MTKNEAASVAWEEEFHKTAMEYRAASIAATPAAYANLLRLAQAALPAAPVQNNDAAIAAIQFDIIAKHFPTDPANACRAHAAVTEILAETAPAAPASEPMYGEHRYRIPAGFVLQPIEEAEKTYAALSREQPQPSNGDREGGA